MIEKNEVQLSLQENNIVRYLAVSFSFVISLGILSFFLSLYWQTEEPIKELLKNRMLGIIELNSEVGIGTLYSSILILVCSVLLWLISCFVNQFNRRYFLHWRILSIIFLLMCIDESVGLHEGFTRPVRYLLKIEGGIFTYAWVIPGLAFALTLFLSYQKFLFHLPAKIRNLFIISGSIYLSGAIGIEMLGGMAQEGHVIWLLFVIIEESLEKLGMLVFIYALLKYMRLSSMQFLIDFNAPSLYRVYKQIAKQDVQ